MSETSKPHSEPQGAHKRLAEADTAGLFAIVRNLRLAGWEREVALKRIEEQNEKDAARIEVELDLRKAAYARIKDLEEQYEGSITRESGLALIEDAKRWEKAYREARDQQVGLQEQYGTLRAAVDAFFAEPFHYKRVCWDSFCGGGSHTTLCKRVNALAHTSFPASGPKP